MKNTNKKTPKTAVKKSVTKKTVTKTIAKKSAKNTATKKTVQKKTSTNKATAKTNNKAHQTSKSIANSCESIGSIMAGTMSRYASRFASFLIVFALAFVTVVSGCKSIPTVDDMSTASVAIGVATGSVCNMTKIDDTSRNAIIDIMNKVDGCIPETNQTFSAAWTPIAEEHVKKLVDEQKIDAKQGELILDTFKLACKGIDYLFDVRYPKARQYQDLVTAAVHGFTRGFLTVFKPANSVSSSNNVVMDMDAYEYLLSVRNEK